MATDAIVAAVPVQQSGSLMTVIERLSATPNVDIDKLSKLLEMEERWKVNKDKAALRHGLAEFKKNPPQIIKQRIAKIESQKGTYSYSYADLENVCSAIQAGLAEYGITSSWKIAEKDSNISVTCVLKYGMYEEEGVTLTAPPDTSGSKNNIQAKGSTLAYLEKYTLLAATGMAAGMPDTDGNAAPKWDGYEDALTLIEKAANHDELKGFFQAAVRAARKANDKASEKEFTEAKDKRKAELEAIQ